MKATLRGNRLWLWCPGCDDLHCVTIAGDVVWEWDGNLEAPTISPSILVRGRRFEPPVTPENLDEWQRQPWEQHPVDRVCHSFVKAGVWEFLSDSNHHLAGQHVPLVDIGPRWPWPDPE